MIASVLGATRANSELRRVCKARLEKNQSERIGRNAANSELRRVCKARLEKNIKTIKWSQFSRGSFLSSQYHIRFVSRAWRFDLRI